MYEVTRASPSFTSGVGREGTLSNAALRVTSCAVLLVLSVFGTSCREKVPEPTPQVAQVTRALEAACTPEGVQPSELVYVGAASATYGVPATVAARLSDASGQPLVGREVLLQLGTQAQQVTTDAAGLARTQLTPPGPAGALEVTAHFAGDATHAASQTSAPFQLERAPTLLRLVGPTLLATDAAQPLVARLQRLDDSQPVAGRTVTFTAGAFSASATTDASGEARVALPAGVATGTLTVHAGFAGDGYFAPAQDAGDVLRYLPTAFSIWGGNTPGLQLGDRVNFWGHSWAKQVLGGDYDAQADHKGWAPGLAAYGLCQPDARTSGAPRLTQGCWSSKTGNSFPPSTLPQYIGVIVTTAVAKAQGELYGNVAGVGVVKVDPVPAYGPVPGKPGFGTLVAVAAGGYAGLPVQVALSAAHRQPTLVSPGEAFQVTLDVGNASATPAHAVAASERFGGGVSPAEATQALGTVAGGATVSHAFSVTAPTLAPRGASESETDYLARLAALDGAPLVSSGSVTYTDPSGAPARPVDARSWSRVRVPRLVMGVSAVSCAEPCTTLTYTVTATNLGLGKAATATALLRLPDATERTLELGVLEPGATGSARVDWALPSVAPRGEGETQAEYLERLAAADGVRHAASVRLTWTDAKGGAYGPLTREVGTTTRLPVVSVTTERPLSVLPGEAFTATFRLANLGTSPVTDAQLVVEGAAALPPVSLAPGASVSLPVALSAPAVAPRAAGEGEVDYLARLRASDRQPLSFPFRLDWAGACSTRFGPLAGVVRTTRVLPIVVVTLEGTADAEAGDTLEYVARLENVGSADAHALALVARLPDGSTRAVPVGAGPLARGGALSVPFDYVVPPTTPAGTVTTVAQVAWKDAQGGAHGLLSALADTRVRQTNAPPVVHAGPDQTLTLPTQATLAGTAQDDGRPAPLSTAWVQVSGPAPALILDPASLTSGVRFTEPGDYVLRLVGTDSEFTAQDELVLHVLPREGSGSTLPGGEVTPGEEVINVVRKGNALRLDDTTKPFNFIWVAVSTKGTIVKLDTATGKVLGEYWTAPNNESKDPSRTTVDKTGSVWATNRANNSVVHVGLVENGQCVDRNGNGRIDTSTGQGDVRAWGNASSTANNAAVATAADECILHYVKVRSAGTRHVSITEDNDVWVSGTSGRYFDLIDGRTGVIKRQEPTVNHGGYGGLIDRNGVIWSTSPLMRWDTSKPLTGVSGVNWRALPYASYGVCLAPDNNVWVTEYGSNVRKFAPDGTLLGTYYHGAGGAQGCVVAPNGDVWVAHSLNYSSVGHLKSDGRLVGVIPVGQGPTGVAVDGAGKVWSTNYYARKVSRIDPNGGALWSGDGVTRVGAVDFTSVDLGGNLYNYSDMTGSTLSGAPESGTWSYVYDSGEAGSTWGKVAWLGDACGDGALKVSVQSSESRTAGFGSPVVVLSGQDFEVPPGRFLKVSVNFTRSSKGESPVLHQLTVATDDYVLDDLPANGAPHVSAGRDRSVTLPDALRVTGTACDDALPAGGPLALTWAQVSGPGTATFSAPGQEATDVSFSAPGTYVLRLTASDGSLSGSDETTVTVEPHNAPPAVSATGPAAITLPDEATLTATLSDDGLPAGGALGVTWSKVSGPGTVTFSDAAAATTRAAFGAAGAYVLRATAFDGHLTRSADVAVQVQAAPPVNQAPRVSAGPNLSVAVNTQVQLNGSVQDDGLVNATPALTWSRVSGPGTVSFTATNTASTRATFSALGTYVLRLTANDGGLSASADVVVAVGAPAPDNAPPQVSAGPNRAVTLPGVATLDGNVLDDGLPSGALTVTWARQSGPAGGTVTFASPGSAATTASFSAAGTYVLRLSASDGQFTSFSEVAVVVSGAVAGNAAPVVAVSPSRTITLPTRTASFAGDAADDGLPAGAALTYAWSVVSGPAGLVFTTPTQKTTTVSVTAPGVYQLRLTASDTRLTGAADTVLTVRAEPEANQPPVVDQGPNLTVMQPADAVALAGTATDDGRPEGGTLSVAWRKLSGPGTVTFADATRASTTAAFSASGDYVLELSASDGEWMAYAPKSVRVTPYVENRAPLVGATAPPQVALPDAVLLSGSVRDDGLPADGVLSLAWTQVSGPGTATFTRPNQASTYATFSGPGDYVLRLTASDGSKSASVDVTVRAVQSNRAPSVSAGPPLTLAHPERTALLAGSAADDGLPAGGSLQLQWSVAGGPGAVAFADSGAASTQATFSFPGTYLLRLTAFDGERSASADTVVNVQAAAGDLPQVALTSPAADFVLKAPTVISGTVDEGTWKVDYAPSTGDDSAPRTWTTLASGEAPVSGPLATIDPTLLLNGAYEIRVIAATSAGTTTRSVVALAEGNLKLGNFALTFTDLQVPVAGVPFDVERTYDSRSRRAGDFGVGWTLGLRNVRVDKSAHLGRFWQQTKHGSFLPSYCVSTTKPVYVTVTFPDDRVYKFRAVSGSPCQQIYPLQTARLAFEPETGTRGTLVVEGDDEGWLVHSAGIPGPVILADLELQPINPTRFQLRTEDGTTYFLDQAEGLRGVRDPNGNTLSITRDGIFHSSGQHVRFERDAAGRIRRMVDPLGNALTYTYDAAGDLVQVVDRSGHPTGYSYAGHYLTEVRDARGNRAVRTEYDDAGRVVRHVDALGHAVEFTHDLSARSEVIKNRLGQLALREFDADGNLVRETDFKGQVTTRTFDARGNLLTETNPLGQTRRWTYDGFDRVASETDAAGNVTATTYNALGLPLTVRDARGGVTTSTYDDAGNLLSLTDPSGAVVRSTYDGQGRRLSTTDALGRTHRFEYDSAGKLTADVDALGRRTTYTYDALGNRTSESLSVAGETTSLAGAVAAAGEGAAALAAAGDAAAADAAQVTRYEYDASGRLTRTTFPDGRTRSTTYAPSGQPLTVTDEAGNTTTHAYDDRGQRVRTTYADGTFEAKQYDAEGRVVQATDREGRTSVYAYDGNGMPTRMQSPTGVAVQFVVDALGRPAETQLPGGGAMRTEYDAAGNVVRTVSPAGYVTLYGHDAEGRVTSVTDPTGAVTRTTYDEAGRRASVVLPDGATRTWRYDAEGSVVAEVDEDGRTTAFAWDDGYRLAALTNPAGETTRFTYDALDNLTSVTDAEGRVTRMEYDAAGNRTRRVLPTGEEERWTYDALGSLASHTDVAGRTTQFVHGSRGELLRRTRADGTTASFTYTPGGQRATATDARGTVHYTYDGNDQLAEVRHPDGRRLSYGYDAAGRRTRLTAHLPGGEYTTTYAYDADGLLTTVTDPAGRVFRQSQDGAGRRTGVTFPNAVQAHLAWSASGRLQSASAEREGLPLHGLTYASSASGRRLGVEESDGVRTAWSYDPAGRLLQELVTGGAPGTAADDRFTYDRVGNRLTRQRTAGGATRASAYTYDARDRLLSDGSATYDWTAVGQLAARTGPAAATFAWDAEDRLAAVVLADGTRVEHLYDPDGLLTRTRYLPPSGPPRVVDYLVDASGKLAHVVAETSEGGAVLALHVRGDELLSTIRPSGTRYVHTDGLGSVRVLTDEAGAVTDRYRYAAFGELVASEGADPNPYRFAGEAFDPVTGLGQLRARWLDPQTGRFLSVDPFDGVPEQPGTLHRYGYGLQDPANFTDPSGEFVASVAGLSFSINIQGNMRATQGRVQVGQLARVKAQLRRVDFGDYKYLKNKYRGQLRQNGEEVHHLLEKRLLDRCPALRKMFRSHQDMPAKVLKQGKHDDITEAWRRAFPYKGQRGYKPNLDLEDIVEAAWKIYAKEPDMLRSILMALL